MNECYVINQKTTSEQCTDYLMSKILSDKYTTVIAQKVKLLTYLGNNTVIRPNLVAINHFFVSC